MDHEENPGYLSMNVENLTRFIVGLEPGDPSTGAPPWLVILERFVVAPPEEGMDGCARWRNDVAVAAMRPLSPAMGLPAMVDEVCAILAPAPDPLRPPPELVRDFTLIVNVTHGAAMRRLLGEKKVWGTSVTIGAQEDERNHVVTEPSLSGAVRLALEQERLKVAKDLPQAHAVTSAFEGRNLRPGLSTAIALAVWWWSRTSTDDVPIATRRPTPEQADRAYRARHQNVMIRRAQERRRENESEQQDLFGVPFGGYGR
jgi:hypothetical protein